MKWTHSMQICAIDITCRDVAYRYVPVTHYKWHQLIPCRYVYLTSHVDTSRIDPCHWRITNDINSFQVQPIPLRVTFSNAVSKLKARTSLFTETWPKRRSSFELWAFENVTPSGIGCRYVPLTSHEETSRIDPCHWRITNDINSFHVDMCHWRLM